MSTTPQIYGVLIVPVRGGSSSALLAIGGCSFSPPAQAIVDPDGNWVISSLNVPSRALPVWWEGRLCAEGWDRARRVLNQIEAGRGLPPIVNDPTHVDGVIWAAQRIVKAGYAERVIRLVWGSSSGPGRKLIEFGRLPGMTTLNDEGSAA